MKFTHYMRTKHRATSIISGLTLLVILLTAVMSVAQPAVPRSSLELVMMILMATWFIGGLWGMAAVAYICIVKRSEIDDWGLPLGIALMLPFLGVPLFLGTSEVLHRFRKPSV